jgi:hypothetical protein
MSTGAKAGVGIGASLGALALIGCGILLGRYLSKRKANEATNTYAGNSLADRGVYDAGGYPHGTVTYAQNAETVHQQWLSGRVTPTAELADEKKHVEMAVEKDPKEMA